MLHISIILSRYWRDMYVKHITYCEPCRGGARCASGLRIHALSTEQEAGVAQAALNA
ncbi:MAG: hypothetical protein NUV96_00525 [Candidatus Colwellbacteria bacterium]|nr:hypothetical protein [Candidatus Colwellbacteria bacterium]